MVLLGALRRRTFVKVVASDGDVQTAAGSNIFLGLSEGAAALGWTQDVEDVDADDGVELSSRPLGVEVGVPLVEVAVEEGDEVATAGSEVEDPPDEEVALE